MDLVAESFRLLNKYGMQYIQIEFEKKYPERTQREIAESIQKADELLKAVKRSGHLYNVPYANVWEEALNFFKSEVPNLSQEAYGLALHRFMRGYIM